MRGQRNRLERRRLLGLLGTGAVVGAAGCLDELGAGSDEADSDENDDDGPTYDPNVEHPGDDPIEFTTEHQCVVCTMPPIDYPDHQSQLAHENGDGAVTCSPGCLMAYHVATTSDSEVAGAWMTEITSGELVDATDASIVLVTDEEAADDPMGVDPRVFADHEEALEFVDDWDAEDLSEEDIIEFEEIDRDVAEIYRSTRL